MAQPEIPANCVPGPENVHGIQPTNFLASQQALGTTNPQTLPGGPQTHLMYSPNQPRGNMPSGSFLPFDPRKFISEQTGALGVIQILLGLIHIFSAIKPWWYYKRSTMARTGYPIWGGISFMISGFLSVYAVKNPNIYVVERSLRMNMISANLALFGICFLIIDVFLLEDFWVVFSVSLLPFTVLEFCLSCVVSFPGCQAECCKKDKNVTPDPIAVKVNPASTTTYPASMTTSPPYPIYANCAH